MTSNGMYRPTRTRCAAQAVVAMRTCRNNFVQISVAETSISAKRTFGVIWKLVCRNAIEKDMVRLLHLTTFLAIMANVSYAQTLGLSCQSLYVDGHPYNGASIMLQIDVQNRSVSLYPPNMTSPEHFSNNLNGNQQQVVLVNDHSISWGLRVNGNMASLYTLDRFSGQLTQDVVGAPEAGHEYRHLVTTYQCSHASRQF